MIDEVTLAAEPQMIVDATGEAKLRRTPMGEARIPKRLPLEISG
jgi:hypothetical protein